MNKIIEEHFPAMCLYIDIFFNPEEPKIIRGHAFLEAKKIYDKMKIAIRNEKILEGIENDKPIKMRF